MDCVCSVGLCLCFGMFNTEQNMRFVVILVNVLHLLLKNTTGKMDAFLHTLSLCIPVSRNHKQIPTKWAELLLTVCENEIRTTDNNNAAHPVYRNTYSSQYQFNFALFQLKFSVKPSVFQNLPYTVNQSLKKAGS